MMISPELYIEQYNDLTYKELLAIRDELLDEIRAFENGSIPEEAKMIMPSPDTIYQCNLEYLSEVCALLVEKYREEREAEIDAIDEAIASSEAELAAGGKPIEAKKAFIVD